LLPGQGQALWGLVRGKVDERRAQSGLFAAGVLEALGVRVPALLGDGWLIGLGCGLVVFGRLCCLPGRAPLWLELLIVGRRPTRPRPRRANVASSVTILPLGRCH
jgi:hypothetical protein